MSSRPDDLVARLGLKPHPEGGFYRETFRSTATVHPDDGRPARAALTTIYFLLTGGDVSRWHRVASDEAWHLLEGDPLELWTADGAFEAVEVHRLGPVADGAEPSHVVPSGMWQAARTTGTHSLAGCTVGPGFDFADFELIDPDGPLTEAVRQRGGDAFL